VRLDRAATHGTLRRFTAHVGEAVVACGANFGTRVMCDPRAQVVGSTGSVLTLMADVAIGASGGPVLDHDGRLLGMLFDGAVDFAPGTGCVTEAIRTNPGKERAMTVASVDAPLCRLTGEDACERPEPGGACQAGRPRSPSRGDLALALFVFLLLFRVKSACDRRGQPCNASRGMARGARRDGCDRSTLVNLSRRRNEGLWAGNA